MPDFPKKIEKDTKEQRDDRCREMLIKKMEGLRESIVGTAVILHQIKMALLTNHNDKAILEQQQIYNSRLINDKRNLKFYVDTYNNGNFNFLDELI